MTMYVSCIEFRPPSWCPDSRFCDCGYTKAEHPVDAPARGGTDSAFGRFTHAAARLADLVNDEELTAIAEACHAMNDEEKADYVERLERLARIAP